MSAPDASLLQQRDLYISPKTAVFFRSNGGLEIESGLGTSLHTPAHTSSVRSAGCAAVVGGEGACVCYAQDEIIGPVLGSVVFEGDREWEA